MDKEKMVKKLGNPEVPTDLKQTITQGVIREPGNRSVEQLAQEESEILLGLLGLRARPFTNQKKNIL
jgi:hypothetical protein